MKPLALPRNVAPIAWVTLLHAAAIWALATHNFSEVREPQPVEISVELGSEVLTVSPSLAPSATTAPKAAPVNVAKPTQATPMPEARPPAPAAARPTETSNAEADNATPTAKAGIAESRPGPASAFSANATTAPTFSPSTASVQLPSSDADYLNNPKPAYPPMSRRLGEQGTVIVRTLIGEDGIAQKAEVQQSSGFARLDRAAVETALKWRYLPGKRAGVPEAMWFNVPLRFVLE